MTDTPPLTALTLSINGPYGDITLRYAFDLASHVQKSMHDPLEAGSFYEPATTRLLLSILKPGDTFIDIGGHVGYFTVLAAALVGESGEVIAFEPSPANYRHLVEHVALNGFTNVLPMHMALGDREHVAALHLNADNDGGHALWDVGVHRDNHKSRATPHVHPAYVSRLDNALRGRPIRSLKAVKLDVEGSEVCVLRGAAETLHRHNVPFVVAEVNRQGLHLMGASEIEMRTLMAGLGYECWLIQDASPELVPLSDGMTVDGHFVFNLLFRRPGAIVG